MQQTLEGLKGKIKTTNKLRDIVSSMKTLSAVSITQYEKAASALNRYNNNLKHSMKVALIDKSVTNLKKEKKWKGAISIIFGSDQGLVGRFNSSIAKFAKEEINEHKLIEDKKNIKYIAVGRSLAPKILAQDYNYDSLYSMPSSVKAITNLAQILVLKIDTLRSEFDIEKVVLFHNKKNSATTFIQKSINLLPIDDKFLKEIENLKWPNKKIPMKTLSSGVMMSSLISQILFVQIYRAIAESLTAEHMTRMISMQNAEKNIDEHLDKMNLEYQQRRQQQITEELIDVVSGAEVLNAKKKKKKQAEDNPAE